MTTRFLSQSLLAAGVTCALAMGVVAPAGAAETPTVSTADSGTTASHSNALLGGTFAWPIKSSFISYVRGPLAKGSFSFTDGASFSEEQNQFLFPVDPGATHLDATGNGSVALRGSVHIIGHKNFGGPGKHGLDLTYSNLKITVDDTKATLVGDYVVSGVVGGKEENKIDKTGTQEPLITFSLPSAIAPGHDSNFQDATSYAATGMVKSLQHYEVGEELANSAVDLVLDYDDGKDPAATTPNELTSSAQFSVEMGQDSGKFAGVVIGILAALGFIIAGIAAAVNGAVPGLGEQLQALVDQLPHF
ncbi:hypothetical protein HMPREF1219_01755 [Corynebacterium pyruviciproducens ATCC BAA-1742]|uniref:Htaa domain-containing protein n=1 Tax=Corynebacterium pyruviciproducens ATCC BAA-1742 TaxID=1125779 RepID=S2YW66_9CORY|nr:HtaA domain-containing protein [Corynebacterium pyruviciproducens]EPD68571.1 hypothetical protein HMPREF1219_01755 [Corynebacterium pyruviciproducens ATCC BAA-1742]